MLILNILTDKNINWVYTLRLALISTFGFDFYSINR